jgi:hypothetical protein
LGSETTTVISSKVYLLSNRHHPSTPSTLCTSPGPSHSRSSTHFCHTFIGTRFGKWKITIEGDKSITMTLRGLVMVLW